MIIMQAQSYRRRDMEKILDIQETASYLHISISTLYRWVHYRKIEYIKIGSKVLFSENYLKEFIKSNTNIVLD